jgi:hypothetical protein
MVSNEVTRVNAGIREQKTDDPVDMYVEWRIACIALGKAYDRWSSVPVGDRKLAFAVYQAALDLEEHASVVYAERIGGVTPPTPARAARWPRAGWRR